MQSFDIKTLSRYPEKSGVYLMKDEKDRVLYVGKANNLKARLRQYFTKSGDDRAMIPYLIRCVRTIDVIVVPSERDALILESTLIKKHKPKYNALLKDDKRYMNIVLTKHPWPRLKMERHKKRSADIRNTFGPYTNAKVAREVLDLMNRIFPLRECSDEELSRRTRPCLLHGMKRCEAPCVNLCSKETYLDLVTKVRKLLSGKDQSIIESLKQEMQKAAENLLFEKAASLRDMIGKIEQILSKQYVDNSASRYSDVIGLYREADYLVIIKLLFREHRLIGSDHFTFSSVLSENPAVLETFFLQHYEKEEIPEEILVPIALENQNTLAAILSETRGKKVTINRPQKGEKTVLLRMALDNAKAVFHRDKDAKTIREKQLLVLQETLSLQDFPKTIACLDSSNIQGAYAASAVVVFVDGKKEPSLQRYFTIDTKGKPDDYASLKEALRRYTKKIEHFPDLLIIDGGKGHLNTALKVLEEENIAGVDVIGIAKEASLHTKGLTKEVIHRPFAKPLSLPKHSPSLFLLQKIRDETHRVVISFHRKKRSKSTIQTQLEEVPGIGPKKRTILLKSFGSVTGIKASLKEGTCKIEGISKKDIEALEAFFFKNA